MPISQTLLPEFDREMAGVRVTLERVPEDKFGWKPHEKSMALGRLANHLAHLVLWASATMAKSEFDVAPVGSPPPQFESFATRQELLASFDKNVAAARALLETATDDDFMKPWSLLSGGRALFTMPKAAVLRTFVLSHTIHHRAQLGLYLRLNDIPVPALYGPTADEGTL
jgi:uncharacterized damage-inducible protein DinB